MRILEHLHDAPNWAVGLLYFGAVFLFIWGLVSLHNGSGPETTGQDPRGDRGNHEEETFCPPYTKDARQKRQPQSLRRGVEEREIHAI